MKNYHKKRKIILHTSFFIGICISCLLFIGTFSFPKTSYGGGSFTSSVVFPSITNNSAVVSGNGGTVAAPGTDITIRVGLSTDIAMQDITTSTTVNTDGTFSFTIPPTLSSGTTYCYSISDSPTDPTFTGSSVVSASGSFTTTGSGTGGCNPSAGTGSFTSSVVFPSITNNSAVVSGNGGTVAAPGTDITIRVGTSTSIATQDITTSTTVNTDGTFTFTIPSELTPGTTYHYSISDSPTDATFTGASVTSASGSFTTTGTAPGGGTGGGGTGGAGGSGGPVVISWFNANANSDGLSINFTASASTTSAFDFSFICSTSTSMVHPETQTFSVDSTTLPLISGSLDLTTPISSSVTYYCEIIDASSRILTSEKTVTRASGSLGSPFVISTTSNSATIGINFASSTTVTSAPVIYYGGSATAETNNGGTMSSDAGTPNNYTGTITGLSSSTTYYYAVMDTDNNPYGGTTSNSFTTSIPAPILPTISGDYTSVDTSAFDNTGGKGIVRCKGGLDLTGKQVCGWPELMDMVNRIIKFLVFIIAPALCAGMLLYGGWLYLTSAAGSEVGKAKSMITSALLGWLIALAAWIIIKFIMQSLGYNESIFPTYW